MEPLALTIPEAAKLGGPKRDKAYREIKAGRLRAVKRGRNTLILVADLKEYLASLPAIEPQSANQPEQHGRGSGRRPRTARQPMKSIGIRKGRVRSRDGKRFFGE